MVLILSLILSLFGWGRTEVVRDLVIEEIKSSVCNAPSSEKAVCNALNRDICITSAQGSSFSGNNNTNSVSIRNSNTGRRTSPQTKSTFRIVKSGKVIDNNNLHPFLTSSFFSMSGQLSSERYLYSICRLRI